MIEHIHPNVIPGITAQDSPKEGQTPSSPTPSEADATLQVRFASQIAKALESPAADADAIKAAETLLASGEIDSRESARQAAQSLLDFGV